MRLSIIAAALIVVAGQAVGSGAAKADCHPILGTRGETIGLRCQPPAAADYPPPGLGGNNRTTPAQQHYGPANLHTSAHSGPDQPLRQK